MPYIQYELEDGNYIWVELNESETGPVKASAIGEAAEKARQTFSEALENARLSALEIIKIFHDAQADEVKVKFGLKATGEVGNNIFAIGKAGVEANYEVTLKWKKNKDETAELAHYLRQRRLRHGRS